MAPPGIAVPDIPDHDAMEHKMVTVLVGPELVRRIPFGVHVSPVEWFSGETKQSVLEFIEFVRAGQFEIR